MDDTTQGEDDATQRAQIRTFLIADVRGYTLFTQERGDEAAAKLAEKVADIARDGVEARGGELLAPRRRGTLRVLVATRSAPQSTSSNGSWTRRSTSRSSHSRWASGWTRSLVLCRSGISRHPG